VAATHTVLVRHELNVLPARRRGRHRPKRDSRPLPGDRVQMDTCKIRPGLHQYSVIDDCSRDLVLGLSRHASAADTLVVLEQVLDEMPFAIQRIQTDRGAEFSAESVQRRLMDLAITFRPIPPRSPHFKGKVERTQRIALDAFWPTVNAKRADVGDRLALWVHHYNWDRPHESLGGLTPIDRVCEPAEKTPLRADVSDSYDADHQRSHVRHHAVDAALPQLKGCP